MPLTSRMKWTVPSENADPWYDAFVALFGEMDASAYASREDRNIILMGGGDITWALSTGILSWTEPLRVFSPVSGFQCIVAAGYVQLDQSGKLLHAPLVRYPTGSNKTIIAAVASQVPVMVSGNDQLLFAVRYGNLIYWRNGLVMQDGDVVTNFRPEYGGGGGSITLGGDLTDWIPTPDDSHQRVVGFNTVPIPHPELPTHRDLLQAQAELLLSNFPFDSTTDGTRVWVGDIESPLHGGNQATNLYGGLVAVEFADDFISTRFEYDSAGLGVGANIQVWSVCYLNGYVYATGMVVVSGEGGTTQAPGLFRFDPADGSFNPADPAQYAPIPYMAYVRTDGDVLYLLMPWAGSDAFWWVDTADLSLQTLMWSPSKSSGSVGFAYDPILEKVWMVSTNNNQVSRFDKTTHALDFTNTMLNPDPYSTPMSPSGIVYGNGNLWLLIGSQVDGNYTYAYPYNYGYYPPYTYPFTPQQILMLDPTDGSIVQTVVDPGGTGGDPLVFGCLRIDYDSTNNTVWAVCDSPFSWYESLGPRALRIDCATWTIDGWCSLDTKYNMSVTAAGGYVWVVDSPGGDPDPGYPPYVPPPVKTILKIDPTEVSLWVDPIPAPGVIARITSGAISYQFIKKNQDIVVVQPPPTSYPLPPPDMFVLSEYETILGYQGGSIYFPVDPVDGERHTVVDFMGAAAYGPIIIYWWFPGFYGPGSYQELSRLTAAYQSSTFVWSAAVGSWVQV